MSDQYPPNGGTNHSGQGWQYKDGGQRPSSGHSGGRPPQKPAFNLREWIPVIILFCIPSGVTQLIGLIMALSKISRIIKEHKAYQESLKDFGRTAAGAAREVADAVRREVNNARSTAASSASQQKANVKESEKKQERKTTSHVSATEDTRRPSPAKKGKKVPGGTALVVLGIIFGCGCGFSALMCLITSAPIGFLVLFILTAISLGMLLGGVGKNRRKERCLNYLAYIGTNRQVSLAHMAASFDVSVKKLCKDLRWMLAKGVLPTGYLDLAAGKLFLTEEGYRAPEPEAAPTPEEQQRQEDDILREIRQVNDEIPDEEMSAKIDRIEEITGKILAYQKTHPDRSGQLRSFLNYYLPTTLKILRAYAQLDAQGIEGENISAAKARIEGMMDQVVAGFEKQLDKLFRDDAMDISSDVQVLENMLKKDGLSDDQHNITMTL